MQVVIEIPKFVYDMAKAQKKVIDADVEIVGKAIIGGTVLQENHGRLIDADKLGLTDFEIVMCDGDYKEGLKMLCEKIENAPTILEAEVETDKGGDENGNSATIWN